MTYNPTNWQNGDVITSEKLNKIENGIASAGGGGLSDCVVAHAVCTSHYDDQTEETTYTVAVDMTWNEVMGHIMQGVLVIMTLVPDDADALADAVNPGILTYVGNGRFSRTYTSIFPNSVSICEDNVGPDPSDDDAWIIELNSAYIDAKID